MATTNYNLPTISDNMTADVVRDHNALAEAVDDAIETVDTKITSHLEQNAVAKHKSSEISVVAPVGITASNTQEYLDALFTGYSSKLTDMVDALLLINPSLPINQNSTMQDIVNALESGEIGGLSVASGSGATAASLYQFELIDSNLGENYVNFGALTITNLPFLPKKIVLSNESNTDIAIYDITMPNPYYDKAIKVFNVPSAGQTTNGLMYNFKTDKRTAFINENSFCLPFRGMNTVVNWTIYDWV